MKRSKKFADENALCTVLSTHGPIAQNIVWTESGAQLQPKLLEHPLQQASKTYIAYWPMLVGAWAQLNQKLLSKQHIWSEHVTHHAIHRQCKNLVKPEVHSIHDEKWSDVIKHSVLRVGCAASASSGMVATSAVARDLRSHGLRMSYGFLTC